MPSNPQRTRPQYSTSKAEPFGSRWLIALAAGTAATLVLLWATDIPLGIPGEWTWNRIEADGSAEWLLGILQAGIGVGLYLAAFWISGRGIADASRRAVGFRLIVVSSAAYVMQLMVQESPPGLYRLQKAPLVLYAPSTSGYFFHQRFHVDELSEFLRGYEAWVHQGDVLHFGTHPPGLFVFHRGISALCDGSPALTAAIEATEPDSVRETFAMLREFPMGAPEQLSAADRASLWLSALVSQAVGVATLIPLFGLVRQQASRRTAWFAAVLWPLVPASVLFQPKSDVLYPFVGMLFLWCWTSAFRQGGFWKGVAAGTVLFAGMFTSLALLPAAFLGAILFLSECAFGRSSAVNGNRVSHRQAIASLAGFAFGFLIPVVLFWATLRLNLPAVWWQNLANHGAFYQKYPRTVWKWWLVNPIELTIAAGWPAALLAGSAVLQVVRGQLSAERRRVVFSLVAVIVLLWLSGKNSSEAARLWIFLMPWLIWCGALAWEKQPLSTSQSRSERAVLLCQSAALIGTVLRVTGFAFPGL